MAFMTKPARRVEWTSERIAALTTPDVRQLRLNAERLNSPEVVERCEAVLKARRRVGAKKLPAKVPTKVPAKLPATGEAA